MTPEGTRDGRLAPDGKLVLARDASAKYFLYPIAGGEPQPVAALEDVDLVVQWSADGRSVLAYRGAEIPCHLVRVDLESGRRELFKEIGPADRVGLLAVRPNFVADDLRSYAYTAYWQVSSLFRVGVREVIPQIASAVPRPHSHGASHG